MAADPAALRHQTQTSLVTRQRKCLISLRTYDLDSSVHVSPAGGAKTQGNSASEGKVDANLRTENP